MGACATAYVLHGADLVTCTCARQCRRAGFITSRALGWLRLSSRIACGEPVACCAYPLCCGCLSHADGSAPVSLRFSVGGCCPGITKTGAYRKAGWRCSEPCAFSGGTWG